MELGLIAAWLITFFLSVTSPLTELLPAMVTTETTEDVDNGHSKEHRRNIVDGSGR